MTEPQHPPRYCPITPSPEWQVSYDTASGMWVVTRQGRPIAPADNLRSACVIAAMYSADERDRCDPIGLTVVDPATEALFRRGYVGALHLN